MFPYDEKCPYRGRLAKACTTQCIPKPTLQVRNCDGLCGIFGRWFAANGVAGAMYIGYRRPTMTAHSHTMASSRKRRADCLQAVRQKLVPVTGRELPDLARFENRIRGSKVSTDKGLPALSATGIEANGRIPSGLLQRVSMVDCLDFSLFEIRRPVSQKYPIFKSRAAII